MEVEDVDGAEVMIQNRYSTRHHITRKTRMEGGRPRIEFGRDMKT